MMTHPLPLSCSMRTDFASLTSMVAPSVMQFEMQCFAAFHPSSFIATGLSSSVLEQQLRRDMRNFLLGLVVLALVASVDRIDEALENSYYDDEEDILKLGGGTQQTCDGCRTVMEHLLREWRRIDNEHYLKAIDQAASKGEYVPVVPEDEVGLPTTDVSRSR